MQNEPNIEIFHQVFSQRIEIAAALDGALKSTPHDLEKLKEACQKLNETVEELGQGYNEDQYRAYYTAMTIFVSLAEWKHAIRNAEIDAQRYLNSAKLKVSEIDMTSNYSNNEQFNEFLEQVKFINTLDSLSSIQNQLTRWSLPLLLFANLRDKDAREIRQLISNEGSEQHKKRESTVAFLKFDIDGEPAKQWNYLKPGTAYDLTIEVRVSNWPKSANILLLKPVTIDVRERGWLPDFRFEKPEGDGPFTLTGIGRIVLEVANSFGSRPYEFLYAAEFDNSSNCRNVAIIGHRRLLLEGSDSAQHPLTGFSNVDRHLIKIRNKLRAFPGLHSDDIANAMVILGGLGNVAAQSLKASLFSAGTSEQNFQSKIAEMLRSRSDIGEYLQGHPEAAGGITDLTFKDIPVELKVENNRVLFPKDFQKYFDQTAAYAIGLGKRIGILSVLESSSKSAPVGVIEDDIEVFIHPTGQTQIAIVVVIIRGGFPKPSSYSR
ncbi:MULTISPECIES: hypothetical protein [Enterobacteriaceae]|uniref:hypothetical protein n=1 Tax=Enterobacteriaceae TaxID=543 RepID=UPI001575DC46|nr:MULTISPECIES: hypothetical protein [Enterobacteriaceae]MBZ7671579.1 hypothetical protein [Klebsiella grimontii]MEB7913726.1 hypothetical protein [Citrobacter portucalensis]NTY80177.1 hypothetical protein [Citrobacter werkmanii]